MIDTWFIDDIRSKLDSHRRIVITDVHGDGKFMLSFLPNRYHIIEVPDVSKEIPARILAEKEYADKTVVFYTRIHQQQLTSLQEYAKTCGCIVLDDIESYLKSMLFKHLNVHCHIPAEKLLIAAKMSKGKDENWWRGITIGAINPMDVKTMITEFLKDPDGFVSTNDADVFSLMQHDICRLTNRPFTHQKPKALANDITKSIFDALVKNTISQELLDLYYTMTDSAEMHDALKEYIDGYQVPAGTSAVEAHYDHPFEALDRILFHELSNALKAKISTETIKAYIVKRINSVKARQYKSEWLWHALTVLDFKIGQTQTSSTLEDFASYYQKTFAPLDTAMRYLYVSWLNEPLVIRPFQEYYESVNKVVLDVWYGLAYSYQPTQRGLIKNMFAQAKGRTAVIVCDGLRLEMAEAISKRKFSSKVNIKHTTAWSMLPSVTPNGMSALYDLPSPIVDSTTKRHAELKNVVPDVEIMQLMMLNSSVTAEHLVLLYGDIDQIGEKKQLAGLSDIAHYEDELYDKIVELLKLGYRNVFLTTDHGYVITGLLEEADKIMPPAGTTTEERFAIADGPLSLQGFVERQDIWIHGSFQYYAKSDKPFRTRGAYGYSHGGMTPQECLIPAYCFSQEATQDELKIQIENKSELSSVTGQYYKIKIKGTGDGSLFQNERKVKVLSYDVNGRKINESPILRVVAGSPSEVEDSLTLPEMKIVVQDAITTAQLDTCSIKKSTSRDLDDLF